VYGDDPPEAMTLAEPLAPPLQVAFVVAPGINEGPLVFATETAEMAEQPFTSVTVTEYAPAGTLVIDDTVAPVFQL
jgi:hypothetical protein